MHIKNVKNIDKIYIFVVRNERQKTHGLIRNTNIKEYL